MMEVVQYNQSATGGWLISLVIGVIAGSQSWSLLLANCALSSGYIYIGFDE